MHGHTDIVRQTFYHISVIDLEDASGETHHQLSVPAAYIVGADGEIQFEHINPDYRVRIDPDLLLAAAKAGAQKEELGRRSEI